jgi:hypothetical protein
LTGHIEELGQYGHAFTGVVVGDTKLYCKLTRIEASHCNPEDWEILAMVNLAGIRTTMSLVKHCGEVSHEDDVHIPIKVTSLTTNDG